MIFQRPLAELVGLETRYVRAAAIRVEWQLYELDSGEFHRCPPKDGSRRTIHIPGRLGALAADYIGRTQPKPCPCHGFTYTFSGNKAANGAVRGPGPKLIDVARHAGVSAGTVSNFLNRPEAVAESTREAVRAAVEELVTPAPLMDDQMGHSDGSVQARYSHATPEMVSKLLAGLTGLWEGALEARREMSAGSPVAVLDRLLKGREG